MGRISRVPGPGSLGVGTPYGVRSADGLLRRPRRVDILAIAPLFMDDDRARAGTRARARAIGPIGFAVTIRGHFLERRDVSHRRDTSARRSRIRVIAPRRGKSAGRRDATPPYPGNERR
jgi:hypothetical protein